MIHSKIWVLWNRLALLAVIMSFALNGFAQCLSPGTPIGFSITGNNLTAGYTTKNILTKNDGTIIAAVVSGFSAPTVDGSYKIYTVNYSDAFPPAFTRGTNISTANGTCVSIGAVPVGFCVSGGCISTGSLISFTAIGQNTSAGYQTRYVLTSEADAIISSGTSTSITSPSQPGTYKIYVVNYNTAYGNASPTLTAGTNISAIGGGCADTSEPVELCVNSALPVKLVSFSVAEEGKTANLNWATAEETNADYFDIERSADTKDWLTIGEKAATGESKTQLQYSFTDASPLDGINYYRLKMVDKDTKFAYSNIKSARFESYLALYPNPVSDVLFLKETDLKNVREVTISNAGGITVYQSILGKSNPISSAGIRVGYLQNGIYIVKITKTDGSLSTHKVVISK
ncbi:T9SS type A sorting domain-containing protein [Dyadobacter psychrotolerans]|uniref:T9SS type A sorting domain-containing protein n=1 Tax=Dyadobacter psychrotolerans TaxID=2541721 RepID=A0A4V2Z3F9_9BACT|nr:T9SS type A sorting domain-containing protein [Dyadobacter psychrotolerans]TDE12328.1 T9SS type A sorting domain-containing protein [Dyadobacter psychrotolerans]